MEGSPAIQLRGAEKAYGRGKGRVPVLRGLGMAVPRGRIYGLLGPSGCGKTTLLKCILGRLGLDSGQVRVFGRVPGSLGSGVPGGRVGYMPQELALFSEFTIEETLEYFGRLYGMPRDQFRARVDFLLRFLDLPADSARPLDCLSGGQQRRASLAVALLHKPELLILDEPTVGVDPLLRQGIWAHLVELAGSSPPTTVLVTTHYTEEAMQADTVGMMRDGRLLAEGAPQELLARNGHLTLEQVFLQLCQADLAEVEQVVVEEKAREAAVVASSPSASLLAGPEEEAPERKAGGRWCRPAGPRCRVVAACIGKTLMRLRKRWGFLIYTFLLPALQVSLFCTAVGQDPRDLPLAVVVGEAGPGAACPSTAACPLTQGFLGLEANENWANLSCRLLGFLQSRVLQPVVVGTEAEALARVRAGEAWGTLVMDGNFSEALYSRVFHSLGCLDPLECGSSQAGRVRVRLDVTNQQLALTMQIKLVEAFQNFVDQLLESCNFPPDMASLPIVFERPVYGTDQLTFTDFMVPGIILSIVHSMALAFSAMLIIIERNEGLLERTWVAGVTPSEASLAHFLCSSAINLVQVVLTLGFMLIAFQMRVEGSYLLLFLLTLLQGMAGTTIGLLISAVCRTQQDATQIALGIFYPNMILSGILWPLEAMPTILRYVAYLLPQTLACEAMRSILLRGWGLEHPVVARGFLVTIAWTLATYLLFKLRIHRSH